MLRINDEDLVSNYTFRCIECDFKLTLDDYKNLCLKKFVCCPSCKKYAHDIVIKEFFTPISENLWEEFFLWRLKKMTL